MLHSWPKSVSRTTPGDDRKDFVRPSHDYFEKVLIYNRGHTSVVSSIYGRLCIEGHL